MWKVVVYHLFGTEMFHSRTPRATLLEMNFDIKPYRVTMEKIAA